MFICECGCVSVLMLNGCMSEDWWAGGLQRGLPAFRSHATPRHAPFPLPPCAPRYPLAPLQEDLGTQYRCVDTAHRWASPVTPLTHS